jgi:hypothetical protein
MSVSRYPLSNLALLLSTLAFLLCSCAGSSHPQVISDTGATRAPPILELYSEAHAATLHFPSGRYSLSAADRIGYYYRAPGGVVQHTAAGRTVRDGGIFVSKRNPRKLRGYIYLAGAAVHVGNLSRAKHEFRRWPPTSDFWPLFSGVLPAHPWRIMSTRGQDNGAIQDHMIKYELIEGLQRAIDNSYRRLREKARHEWESRFAGNDPSDACVSVRIDSITAETPAKALPCAGYLSKPLQPRNGQTRLRLA